ncbi:MAG: DNA polymerase I, partial [Nitrospinota bacterium]
MEKKIEKNKRVYLVDGSSYIYRAFYALKSLSNSKGEPTNAVFGFARMLITLLKKESPDYLAIAFDPRGKTFRHEVFTEYKANRSAMPEDLSRQIPDIHRFVSAFNVKSFIVDGMEADDVIGTLTSRAVSEGY